MGDREAAPDQRAAGVTGVIAMLTAVVYIALYVLFIGFLGIAAAVEEGLMAAEWCAEEDPTEQ